MCDVRVQIASGGVLRRLECVGGESTRDKRGGGLGSRPIFKKFHETYAPS